MAEDKRSEKGFDKKPGGGLIDPSGEPSIDEQQDDDVTEPTEELPPKGLGKKSPDQDLSRGITKRRVRHRGV